MELSYIQKQLFVLPSPFVIHLNLCARPAVCVAGWMVRTPVVEDGVRLAQRESRGMRVSEAALMGHIECIRENARRLVSKREEECQREREREKQRGREKRISRELN